MSAHDDLLGRVQAHLRGRGEVTEGRVLDGDGCFVDGLLVVAVMDDDLCVNVGRDDWEESLAGDGVRPLLFADMPAGSYEGVPGSVGALLSVAAAIATCVMLITGRLRTSSFDQ